MERTEGPEHTDLLTRAVERPSFDENFYFLYLALEGPVRNMRIEITKRDIRVFADMDDMIDSLWDLTLDEFMLGY